MKHIILLFFFPLYVFSQPVLESIDTKWLNQQWDAEWVTCPESEGTAYGVYHARRSFNLKSKPEKFLIHISADNRYRLYVNGKSVVFGPARGDIWHWRYETVDIAPYLKNGENLLAVLIINFGEWKPLSQHSYRTAFIVQGNSDHESIVNTNRDSDWKIIQNKAYSPLKIDWKVVNGFFAAGPADSLNAAFYPWNWENGNFNDSHWHKVRDIGYNGHGIPHGFHRFSGNSAWKLLPRNIPFMAENEERFTQIERSDIKISADFLKKGGRLTIPSEKSVKILMDMEYLTKGYPELKISRGKNALIRIKYAESLIDEEGLKGNRDVTEGKNMFGYYDVILSDGGKGRVFSPLWIRTFRYVELEIITEDEPLILEEFYNIYTGYPFEKSARFSSDDPKLKEVFDIGWRTLEMCADETYWDCPYYEQLQYAGDTRTQVLISQYISGDEQLFRNAIELFDHSRISEGPTFSRYPSFIPQVTPAYSLMWILMIHDYLMLGKEPQYTKKFLPGISSVLEFYESYIDSTGMVGELPYTNHIESRSAFPWRDIQTHIAQHSLLFALTLKKAAEISSYHGKSDKAITYNNLADKLIVSVKNKCYDENRGLFADTPDKEIFSEHVNTLAILADAIPEDDQKALMKKILTDTTLLPSFLFFKFYVFEALKKTGLGNSYIKQLDHWKNLLDYGFTTWPEFDIESRSDCHAWSAHPSYHLLSLVCGISSGSPGFQEIIIEPNPGDLNFIEAEIPHPEGTVYVKYEIDNQQSISGTVRIPPNVTGKFIWNNNSYDLLGGEQSFQFY